MGQGGLSKKANKVQEDSRCNGIQGSTSKEEIKCVCLNARSIINKKNELNIMVDDIGLYRDVWIAAIASSTTSLATRTAAICVRFLGRRERRVYVTMQITFLTRKSALIYRRGLRQRVASLTLNCNGDFAIRAYTTYNRNN